MMRTVKLMMGSGLLAIACLLETPRLCFGQEDERRTAAGLAILGGLLFVFLIFGAVFYVYLALALQTIAKKTSTENAWWAWLPILNALLMLNIAKKPLWWIILLLIPLVNIVIGIIVWMGVAEARGKPNWWGILMIVPVANLVVPGYLAWSD
ncbi:MAG: hypothetical protein DMG22_06360 [Acidobacteria bacterium]|nr:MAG: hypothetical protein DMG22_06360 [Acidobacteriota bacterium]